MGHLWREPWMQPKPPAFSFPRPHFPQSDRGGGLGSSSFISPSVHQCFGARPPQGTEHPLLPKLQSSGIGDL